MLDIGMITWPGLGIRLQKIFPTHPPSGINKNYVGVEFLGKRRRKVEDLLY
jgi:hypothetical protein